MTPALPKSDGGAESHSRDETPLTALSQLNRSRAVSGVREYDADHAAHIANPQHAPAQGDASDPSTSVISALRTVGASAANLASEHGVHPGTQTSRDGKTLDRAALHTSTTGNARLFPAVTIPRKIDNQNKPTLIYDFVSPSRLRSTGVDLSDLADVNRKGLDKISMTGIEQFSEKQLDDIIRAAHPKTVVVIDTRQESHGFIGGKPVSWMATDNLNWGNVDKSADDVAKKEKKKLSKLSSRFNGVDLSIPYGSTVKEKSQVTPLQIKVRDVDVETEKELVERKGGIYLRAPVPDHAAPDLDTLDRFSSNARALVREKGLSNLHFVVHCRGGMGRTTVFMSALDMLTNAPQVSLRDIVDRQVKLRRRDESPITAPGKAYKKKFREEKAEVLRAFHQYAAANPFSTSHAISLKAWSSESGKR